MGLLMLFIWIIPLLSVVQCQPWYAHAYWNSRYEGKDGYTLYDTVVQPWYAHNYWNTRYQGKDGYTLYDAVDTTNGMWSDNPSALQGNYLVDVDLYRGEPRCTGCDCEAVNLTCSGSTIDLFNEDFTKLLPSTFTNPTAVTSIQILQCTMLDTIYENFTDGFEDLVNLQSLAIQFSSIKDFPNIFNSQLEILNLVENDIRFFTANWSLAAFPDTLTHVALAYNNIHWIPDRAFSGSNIKILSVSYNQLIQFPATSFEDMPQLMYLGLDGNMIKSVSKRHILSLKSSPLQHLNLSNNEIFHIEGNALSELQNLTILELHQNRFVTVPVGTFDNLPAILHLELNNNLIKDITREAFTNMPKLISLLLHSQVDGLESIAYNAFNNINQSLEYLWVSNNNLVTFPHQVLGQGIYSVMHTIYADHNQISNVIEFGREAFPAYMTIFWEQETAAYVPYSTVKNLRVLHLGANRITHVEETDFCEMTILLQLHMDSNLLTEDTIDEHTFQCLTILQILGLNSNQIQYVPEAVKYKDYLPSIVELRLGGNHLKFIETNTFTELDTLRTLYLHSNGIISIEDDSFPNESLAYLYLANNEFRFLQKYPFYNLTQLVWLELQSNDITVIPDEAFHNLDSLQTIYLNNNDIKRLLKTHFKDSPLSGYLHFQDNDIGYIEDGTFAHVNSCAEFFLNNNFLSELPVGGDFQSLDISLDFSVANNYITSIRPGTFKDFSARSIYLGSNKIAHIYSGAFDGVSTGWDLDLTNNPLGQLYEYSFDNTVHRDIFMQNLNISVIPSLAFSQVRAEELYLHNSHIQTIEVDAFNGLSLSLHLYLNDNELSELKGSIFGPGSSVGQWLYMNRNGLTELPDDAFDDVDIRYLDLDENYLEIYPGPALAISNLEYLTIMNNQIADIPLGSFTSASNRLLDLNLVGNNITVIQADLFAQLISLEGLHLQDNYITEVQPLAFEGMVSLSQIELQNNQIQFLPVFSLLEELVSLDLTNNNLESIQSGAFDEMPALGNLNLGQNQLGCDCELYFTLNTTYSAIKSGNCSTPVPAALAEVHFVEPPKKSLDPVGLYFTDEGVNKYFLCAGANLTATAPQEYEIMVSFDASSAMYAVLENDTDSSDETNSTNSAVLPRTYYVECTSPVTTTLSTQVVDTLATMVSFDVLFNHTHGVVPGMDYICRLSLEVNGTTSAKSYPVYVTSLTSLNNTLDAGPDDYILDVTYLDFSVAHYDFQSGSHDEYRDITYMRSHYGNWLTDGGGSLTSTMSDWFRPAAAANIPFEGKMVLKYMPTEGTHKHWNNKYFPLDTLGYGHEGQRDCTARLHNFGFTSVITGGVMYEGNGTISVGGGDQVWLAVNKTVLLEVYTEVTAEEVPCKTVDLAPAATPGGGWIVPKSGTIDIITGECDALTTLEDEKVWLELEPANTYHFEVFHVEREACKSQLFIETKDLVFYQNSTVEDPPMDYFLYLPEDFHIDGILEELELNDHFTTGPPFDLTLEKGNEARHFTVKDNTAANVALGATPAPVVYNYTVLQGVDVPFVECPNPAVLIPEPEVTTTETFTITTPLALLTLATAFDYEVHNRYVLVFELIDSSAVPVRTGSIVVAINVYDVNDNCPVVEPDLVLLVPVPSLQVEPLFYLNATDADSDLNAEMYYRAGTPRADPPLDTQYDITMDYFRSVYNLSSIIEVQLVVLDKGTEPIRGTVSKVRLELSNSCLLTALFNHVELTADVNQTDGGVLLRIPGYFVDPYECSDYVGFAIGWVKDDQLFASSSYDITSLPSRGRLNITEDLTGELFGGWVAEFNDLNQYLGIDFWEPYRVTQILIQGRQDAEMWVETFKIVYTAEDGSKLTYTDKDGVSVFSGSTDQNSIVTTMLDPVIVSQVVEIHPQTWHGAISMRMEIIACSVAEYFFYNTRCERCRAGSYCLGDGEIHGCTSCDVSPANISCGVNGTDHSYGGFDQCVSCPDGWICHSGLAEPCPLYHYAPCTPDTCEDTCQPCPEGHSCLGGVLKQCTPGFSAAALAGNCSICTAGTYQNESGQGECLNCPAGYESGIGMDHCNPCPEGTYSTGDGLPCVSCADVSLCACESVTYPCFMKDSNLKVDCVNTAYDGTSFACNECTPGYIGDGITCLDIDECAEYDPCFNGRCINTEPGYQCLGCPYGYTGYFRDGLSFSAHNRIFQCNGQTSTSLIEQICEDVDECIDKNGGCDINAYCLNYQGNYSCGPCLTGYLGSSFYGCHIDNYCLSDNHSCSDNATCVYTGPGTYRCQCNDGYTGTGFECGKDSDLDGHPDKSLASCLGFGCRRDNCPSVPNSGQEDADNDKTGDNCDFDDDNDVVPDELDNCKYVYNPWKTDTDGDGVGDDCDNCVSVNNPEQTDTDGDSIGDECDPDIDGDGTLNAADNCPLVSNPDQANSDGDSHGDVCDNCPVEDNEDQTDTDQNGFGDVCDTGDRDGDGIPNGEDNCPFYSNPSQSDTDNDGTGNACDEDIDGDGLLNVQDNCILVANPRQEDSDGNGFGDVCGTDSDGDGVLDTDDHCPLDPDIQYTSLSPYSVVNLDPAGVTYSNTDLIFEPKDNGEEIVMTKDVAVPLLILGDRYYGDVEYSGTWYVSGTEGNNNMGFVFGYQNNQKFYVVMMRHENWNYYSNYRGGIKGLQVKLVSSTTAPDSLLAEAVWHSADTTDKVKILWQDPDIYPWQHQQPIRWHLIWRPSIGLINVRVVDSEGTEILNSGDLYDTTIQGGKLGVFLFDQTDVSWSQLVARCLDTQNWALHLDGVDDYVELATITQYDLVESFTIETWVKFNDSSIPGKHPIVCTLESSVCVYLQDDLAYGQVGNAVAGGKTTLTPDHWHHVTLRYEYETQSINIFINGTAASADGLNDNAPGLDLVNITDNVLYIGRDNDTFFEGVIDEVRIYNRWVPEVYLDYYIGSFSPPWGVHQKHLRGHYTMNSYNRWGEPVLYDTGLNQLHGKVFGEPAYVQDSLNFGVFQLAFPTN